MDALQEVLGPALEVVLPQVCAVDESVATVRTLCGWRGNVPTVEPLISARGLLQGLPGERALTRTSGRAGSYNKGSYSCDCTRLKSTCRYVILSTARIWLHHESATSQWWLFTFCAVCNWHPA